MFIPETLDCFKNTIFNQSTFLTVYFTIFLPFASWMTWRSCSCARALSEPPRAWRLHFRPLLRAATRQAVFHGNRENKIRTTETWKENRDVHKTWRWFQKTSWSLCMVSVALLYISPLSFWTLNIWRLFFFSFLLYRFFLDKEFQVKRFLRSFWVNQRLWTTLTRFSHFR